MHTRTNAATLSPPEKEKLMNAIITLKKTTKPGHSTNVYDEFVAIHFGVTRRTGIASGDGGHGGPAFFAWHREFILRFEKALQEVDPDVTLPYWKWESGNSSDTTNIFTADFLGTVGLQTSGYLSETPNTQNPDGWKVDSQLDQGNGSTLLRNNNINPGSLPASDANDALDEDDFHRFRPNLEGPHGTIHMIVGGHMTRMTSPNDPIFFLHHANIDRLWAKWQLTHPGTDNYNPNQTGNVGHKLDDRMWPWDGGDSSTTVNSVVALLPVFDTNDTRRPRDVLDIEALDYVYDDVEGSSKWITSDSGQNNNSNQNNNGNICFIATAAYGSELEPPVQFLREFRDDVILQGKCKKTFESILNVYYKFSPPIAEQMRKNKPFKIIMKYSIVFPFVALAKITALLISPFTKKRWK